MPRTRGAVTLLLCLGTASEALGAQVQVSAGTSINDGLAAASAGDTVCVATGTYYEEVTLVPGVALLGGFDAGFSTRDPDATPSTIHGQGVRSCVVSGPAADTGTVVDGFWLRGAGGEPGAAIRVTGGSPVFTNNRIVENRQAGIAGGAFVSGGSSVRFSDNEFRQNSSAGSGGALRIENSAPVLENNLFEGNVARNSGGAIYVFQSTLTASGNTIRDSLAGTGGGAAFFFAECPDGGTVTGTTIEDCEAGNGGAIVVRDESSVSFQDAVIRRCAATSSTGGFGGGVFLLGYSSLVMDGARFENCSATVHGGGIYSFRSALSVTGPDAADPLSPSAFVDCTAQGQGGGIWIFAGEDTSTCRIVGVRFSDCSAFDEGGAFSFEESRVLFMLNLVERCSAGHGGGGAIRTTVSVFPPRSFLVNNTFHECSATLDAAGDPGGALAVMGPNNANVALLAGNIISETLSGACIACTGGTGVTQPTIVCSTINNASGNVSNVLGGTNCVLAFQAGAGTGNAERDPGFCDPDPTDYSLQDCAVETNCQTAMDISQAELRGVTDETCPCNIFSVEEASWGQIKARYRR